MEDTFITYLRTRMLLQQRLKNQSDDSVFIHENDFKRFSVCPAQLHKWELNGTIQRDGKRFRVLKPGTVDLSLIKKEKLGANETVLHKWIKQILMYVELPGDIQPTVYFKAFLGYRQKYLDLFFIVDTFSGRIHTPITSLKKDLRAHILLCGESIASIDVGQMQPTLLAKILYENINKNAFSDAINQGKDIYLMLMDKAQLQSRDEAKKRFFEILFSKPNKQLSDLFDGENWINWINKYKNTYETRNPHSEKRHTNLAWLLQSYEVRIMSAIWRKLAENTIPFLTVHDEIICRKSDVSDVERIMNSVLSDSFQTFKINTQFY